SVTYKAVGEKIDLIKISRFVYKGRKVVYDKNNKHYSRISINIYSFIKNNLYLELFNQKDNHNADTIWVFDIGYKIPVLKRILFYALETNSPPQHFSGTEFIKAKIEIKHD